MLIHYDIPKINRVLDDFYHATGARIDLFNNEFVPISNSGHEICGYCRAIQAHTACQKRCKAFDTMLLQQSRDTRRAQQAICPFGLANAVSPVLWEDTIIGYVFFGQMKTEDDFPTAEIEAVKTEVDERTLRRDYEALPLFESAKIQGVANLAHILIGHILTENMVKPDAGEILQRAVSFIHTNLETELSVKVLTKQINVSKSVLYSKFHAHFHCTPGEYINKKRIEKSVVLLQTTNLSMEEISQACGFSGASYFTKMFKKHRGITPLKFRKAGK